jgi:DNA replication initiation complex subunit (GINS family)
MEAKEVNITYETLFELFKREKDTSDLQKLGPTFFNDFADYLKEKKDTLAKEDAVFSYEQKKNVERQIDNAKKIIKGIYERREKKILEIALIRSRTKSEIMDTSSFLEHEKKLFDEMLSIIDAFRDNVVNKVIEGGSIASTKIVRKEEVKSEHDDNYVNNNEAARENGDEGTKIIKFLCTVPKFVGKELEEYGPFQEEDIANLPADIADVLIGKGRAEEINEG